MTSQKSRLYPAVRTWLAGLAVVTLALIAGGYWYYRAETEHVRQEKYREIATIGKLKADQIERWRKERQRDADRLAHSSFTRKAVGDFLRQPDDAKLRADLREHLQVEQATGTNQNVLLFALDGVFLLAAKEDSHDLSHPTSPALQRATAAALASSEAVISDFYRCPDGVVHIDVAAVVQDAGGQPLAVVVLRRDPKIYLFPLIQSWPTPSRSAETVLAQQEGAEVVFVNELRHETNAVLTLRFPLTRTNLPAVQAVLGKQGQREGTDYRSVAVLADLRPISGSPWFMITKMDVDEILAEARYGAGMISLVVGSLILLAAALTAYVYGRRQAGLFQGLYEAERRQRENLAAFRTTLYSIGDAVITTNAAGQVREMNPVAEKLTGWSEAEARGRPLVEIFRILNETTRAAIENPVDKVLRDGAVVGLGNHTRLITRGGTERPIADSAAPIRDERGTVTGVVLVFSDQTAQQAMQQALRKNNRTLRLLSNCNEVLIRATDESDLLKEICRIVKETGGYSTAWIGFAEDDADKSVRIVAAVGLAPDSVEALKISWADTPRGRGPTGIAIRTGKPCASQDVNTDPSIEPWRNLVAQVDHPSVCALPLLAEGRAFGTLTVYSAEREVFTADETALLQELADDLAFGIVTLRARGAHLRVEEALRKSEALLRESQIIAGLGSYVLDIPTGLWSSSDVLDKVFGIDQAYDYSVEGWVALIHPDDRTMMADYFRNEVLGQGHVFNKEYRIIRHADQTERWVYGLGRLEFDAQGRPLKMRGTIQDITERKQAEQQLHDSEALYHSLVANLPQHVFRKDLAGRFTFGSARFCQSLGKPQAEILGQTDRDFFPAALAAKYQQDDQRVIQTGQPFEAEEQHQQADGQTIWVSVIKTPLRDAVGQVIGLQGIAWDITERKRAEAGLRLQSAALEASANAIVITDATGVIEWANAAFTTYTGYSVAEAIGQNPKLLKSGKHDAAFYRAMWETIRAGKVWQGEMINRRKDGSLYPEDMTITPLKDERGEITHFIAVKQDITKRKTLEEEFHQAQKMEAFGQLAGGVAHDFNNMLAVITGNASLLQMELSADEQPRVVQEIARAAERAANLTRQLLTFSRKQTMQAKVIDLNDVVSGMVKMLHRIIGEDIALETRLLTGGAPMNGDPGMIEQILLNLAVNARDAMPAGGQIAVELANVTVADEAAAAAHQVRPGDFVRLSFRDTGSGIAPELLSRIFEPFFTTKDVGKGTGLGLATVHGIVAQHHGWIEVESQPGQGTTFHIHLPRLAEPEQNQVAAQLAAPVRGGRETILLVEDDMPVRVLAVHALKHYGYRVIEAPNGVAALEIWRQQGGAVDLLLTDMVMPEGVSGRQLAEQLRAEKPGLKVIYMSGYPRETAGQGLHLREGVNFLQKPFANAKLAQTVRDCLDAARERET